MQELPRDQRGFWGAQGCRSWSRGSKGFLGMQEPEQEDQVLGTQEPEQGSSPSPEHSHGLAFPGRRLGKLLPAPIAALHLLF